METRKISTLKINTLVSQEQYDKAYDENKIEQDSIYLVPDNTEEIAQQKANEALENAKEYTDTAVSSKANTTDLTSHTEDTTIHVTEEDKSKWNAKADAEHNHDDVYYTEAEIDEKTTVIEQSLTAQGNEIEVVKGDLTSHATSSNAQFGTIREEFAAKDTENLTTAKEYSDANKSAAVSEAKAYTDSEIEKLVTDTEFEGVLTTIQEIQGAMATDDELAQALETANGKKVDKGAKGSTTKPIYFDENGAQEIAYSIEKDVPADAKFTDTTYTLVKDATNKKIQLMSGETLISEVDDNNTTYEVSTISNSGLLSAEDKTKLDTIETGATKTVIDSELSDSSTNAVQNKVVKNAFDNLSTVATSGSYNDLKDTPNITTYSQATSSTAGLIKVSSVNSSAVTVNSESTTSGRYYPIELNKDGKAIVNVPWKNTTYNAATTSTNGLMSSTDKTNLDNLYNNTYKNTTSVLRYELNTIDNVYSCQHNYTTGEIVIPSKYQGLDVCKILDEGFKDRTVPSLVIKSGVKEIGHTAFQNCSTLSSITIPDTVINIGRQAFEGTSYYNNTDNWDNDILYINNHLIVAKTSLLDNPSIADNIITFADRAFKGCTNLTVIDIPNNVRNVGSIPFYGCTSLEKINVFKNNYYSSLDGVLFDKNKTTIIKYPCNKGGSTYEIPAYVRDIGEAAFQESQNITSITIPDNITHIASSAFYNCPSLTSVTVPQHLTEIEEWTFAYCPISSFDMPPNVTFIGNSSFEGTSITNINLPETVLEIGNQAFMSTKLTNVSIPQKVKSIGDYAFYKCSSLASITIGEGIENIGYCAFKDCSKLTTVTIDTKNLNEVSTEAFRNCSKIEAVHITNLAQWCTTWFHNQNSNPLYTSCNNGVALYVNGELIDGNLQIPDVEVINNYAFYTYKLITSITFSDTVKAIGYESFRGCSNVTTVNFGNSLNKIYSEAFYACTALNNIILPSSLTIIEDAAFRQCTSLTEINIPENVSEIGVDAFADCTSLEAINVSELNSNYSSQDGILFNKDATSIIKYPEGKTTEVYNIPDTVTNISSSSLQGNDYFKSVVIPNSVITIDEFAFYECTALTNIAIPDSVGGILGKKAFKYCKSLLTVKIGEGITTIDSEAFSNCTSLETVILGKNITNINSSAFSSCSKIANVYYTGTEEQWNAITIGSYNTPLTNATIHYNYAGE